MEKLPNQFSIEIKTEEQSRAAQEKLFKLGYHWASGGKTYQSGYAIPSHPYFEVWGKTITRVSSPRNTHYSFEEFMKIVSPQEKIYCVPDKIEAALIHKMVEERGMRPYPDSHFSNFCLGCEKVQSFNKGGDSYVKDYKLVSPHEFIYALGQMSVAPKEVVISVLPWTLTIRGDKFDLGCRKDNNISILKNALKSFGNVSSRDFCQTWLKISVSCGRDGFRADNQFVSWETWDKFVAEVKKVIK